MGGTLWHGRLLVFRRDAGGTGRADAKHVDWNRRLLEMLLAGGTLTLAACGGTVVGAGGDASSGDDATGNPSSSGGGCCNANGDPCCTYEYCEASITPQCACELEGGTWNPYASYNDASEPVGACGTPTPELPDAADVTDAGIGTTDGQCCNANPDPCCTYEFCGASITPQCSCELEGGTWNPYSGYDDASQPVGACDWRPDGGTDGS